jgi:hypothetical protein
MPAQLPCTDRSWYLGFVPVQRISNNGQTTTDTPSVLPSPINLPLLHDITGFIYFIYPFIISLSFYACFIRFIAVLLPLTTRLLISNARYYHKRSLPSPPPGYSIVTTGIHTPNTNSISRRLETRRAGTALVYIEILSSSPRVSTQLQHGFRKWRRRSFAALSAITARTSSIRHTSYSTSGEPFSRLAAYCSALFPRVNIPQHIHILVKGPRWGQGGQRHGRC